MIKGSDYKIGENITLVTHHGAEYPVKVMGHTTLECDLIVQWLGIRPLSGLTSENKNIICLRELRDVRHVYRKTT